MGRSCSRPMLQSAAIKEADEPAKVAAPSQPSELIAAWSSSSPQGPQIHDVMMFMIVLNINIFKYYLNIFKLLFFKILLFKII